MVFESFVVELMNKFLGDYVENLDRSQLQLGIWGGDAVLKNLDLKESALDDLDLPVKVKVGHIAKLTLKIPWKNLYEEPVVAELDGIYALALPNIAIKYDEKKEEAFLQDQKQKKLKAVEEAKKLEAEKDNPKEEKQDSFVEKLAARIIKNLQVQISNIHVRYEDKYTNPAHPFAIGFTLEDLIFQTTDKDWNPCVIKEAVTQIYKLIRLDSLSLYWNSRTELYDTLPRENSLKLLKENIASSKTTTDYTYMIKPICSVAHLRLHTKPEEDYFQIPKIFLTVIFDNIVLSLSKHQYDDILELLESFERMSISALYRKYRPDVPLQSNYSRWWRYAYECILEETVRRRRKMFSWTHIINHRTIMKQYKEAYVKKLSQKSVASSVSKTIEESEKYLDIFCILLMRQKAEVEAAKLEIVKANQKSKGWFGGWFSSEASSPQRHESKGIQDQFYELYTPEEKARLYNAIGYEENVNEGIFPKEYIAVQLVTKLNCLAVVIKDDDKNHFDIMKLQLNEVFSSVSQRPSANAILVNTSMKQLTIFGSPQNKLVPKMMNSKMTEGDSSPLLSVKFETNPLDGSCDTRVSVNAEPLQIIYDAVTVNALAVFFKPPESVYLKQLSQAAMAKFNEVKQLSTTGLKHAIEQHKFTDICVYLKSSYVIVPESGFNRKNARRLILDLGNLKVNSEKNTSDISETQSTVEELLQSAYDKFNIQLDNIQILLYHKGEDWQSARKEGKSKMHILEPISINLLFQKCMFDNQVQLAKMKAFGELPLLSLSISDRKLQAILQLLQSIPFPESEPPPPEEDIFKGPSQLPSVSASISTANLQTQPEAKKPLVSRSSADYINLTDMELKFEIKEVRLKIAQTIKGKELPLLDFFVLTLGTNVVLRTFDMSVGAYLGGIYLQHQDFSSDPNGKVVNLIHTPNSDDTENKLLILEYLKANLDAPDFKIVYKNTEQSISVSFSMLELLLDQTAIIDLMQFAQQLAPPEPSDSVEKSPGLSQSVITEKSATASQSVVSQSDKKAKEAKKEPEKKPVAKKKGKLRDKEIIDIKVTAQLDTITVGISSPTQIITKIKVKGINADVSLQIDKTTIGAELKDLVILNSDAHCYYPEILSIKGSEVLKCGIVAYNEGTKDDKFFDMSCVDTSIDVTIGCMQFVFLNKYVNQLLGFLNQFQAAKEKISEAGEKMAEYSKETVANLQETASRISLCIKMKAPLILVPQHSKSPNILLVDLGNLDINNSFHSAEAKSVDGKPAVIDKMSIQLTSLKVSRAMLNEEKKICTEYLLLEPATLSINVNRNLSAGWYHGEPDMSIDGKQYALALCLSQYDYAVIMAILNENFSEEQPVASAITSKDLSSVKSAESKTTPKATASKSQVEPETKVHTGEVYTSMKFKFTLNSLSATLYMGKDEVSSEAGIVMKRDSKKCLGHFELQVFDIDFNMQSDGSMTANIILNNTILDDSRPVKEYAIRRMIQRYSASQVSTPAQNMIEVQFQQNSKADKDVTVKVCNLHICVCLDYLMTLGNFFTQGATKTANASESKRSIQDSKTSKTTVSAAPAAPERPTSNMNINVSISHPEIVLIEDQCNSETNALVLHSNIDFKMVSTPDTATMSANVCGLQIISSTFKKRDSGIQILNTCEINFHSSAPFNEGQHIQLQTTNLVFSISPATIRTMTAIASGLSAQPAEDDEKSDIKPLENLWSVKPISECDLWYLKTDDKEAVENVNSTDVDTIVAARHEQLLMEIPKLVIKLEGGVGQRTVPLLIVESAFQGEVKDWSSKMSVSSTLSLEVAYYNEKLAVWEPLLEPVVQSQKRKRWDLTVEVAANDEGILIDEDNEPIIPPAKMTINVRSTEKLELTMSKTCLEVLTNLGKAFGDAYKLVEPSATTSETLAPYIIENRTGLDLLLKLDNTFDMPANADSGRVRLAHGGTLELTARDDSMDSKRGSVIKATQEGVECKILFQVEQFGATREVVIKRAEKRGFYINHQTFGGDTWTIVCDIVASYGQKRITLQSIIQVHNHLSVPIDVFYQENNKSEKCGTVQSNDKFHIPLSAVYTSTAEFYFSPNSSQYSSSEEPINWREVEDKGMYQIHCKSPNREESYFMNVCPEIEEIRLEQQDKVGDAKMYTLHLWPTVIIHNLLPMTIRCLLENTSEDLELKVGENSPLFNACIGTSKLEVRIPEYQGSEWIGSRTLEMNIPELSQWTFKSSNSDLVMDMGLHNKTGSGSLAMTFYSPYWMINKTGQDLFYKVSEINLSSCCFVGDKFQDPQSLSTESTDVIKHPSDLRDAILFSFKSKSKKVHKEKEGKGWDKGDEKEKKEKDKKNPKVKEWRQHGKACLQVAESEWSDKFSLDTVGSSGTVQCKNKASGIYEVGVNIRLSSSGLTKIVTFTPYHMMLNTSELTYLVQEITTEPSSWIEIRPQQCIPFWPLTTKIELKAKVLDTNEETNVFSINKPHSTLLKLDNNHGGINIDCQITETSFITTLTNYKLGMASVLLVNHTDRCSVQFSQKDVKTTHMLGSEQAMLYTWENPSGNRELIWTCGTTKELKNNLTQDGIGEFFADNDTKVYWVSFLDGMQRVLLFSQDLALVTIAQQAGELERIEQEINLFIFGLGLSLVNNYNQTEVAYLGITSSGVIWEEKKKRFKALNLKSCAYLEDGYQKYLNELTLGNAAASSRKTLENKFEVDFKDMIMTKPNKRIIRRSFQDGIWLQYKTSPHQLQLHAKINRLQLDNQISGAVFPTVLAPIPPPKSVAADSVPKPFTEISIMQRKHEHSNIVQVKYFKVLIQEMSAKVDQNFLNAILQLFSSDEVISNTEETRLFLEDCKITQTELIDVAGVSLVEEQKNFYDYLHFSPIKIHLSFSLQGGGEDGPAEIKSNILNIFLQSVGVVLTDVQDVVFKLGYFERNHSFYNQSQLIGQMSQHYAGQAIKQMYVLVLGLDVLGNPFGLLRGLGEGLEDLFYEPYQGAIQGPEEFAEGLALGVRSLFGHAVGGAAGAVSRITGAMGKGIAALTLDDEYQKKRREAMNKRPANVREGFARGGKGLVMGVVDGVTGIVRKPIEGAQKEGVEGFFKGIGKGLVGAVTRPTSGVIDFASSSLDSIRRIAEMSDEIRRLRPPRRFHNDLIIRPYNHLEAEGYAILQETEKGIYAATDEYIAHAVVTKDGKNVLLVTDKRLIFANRGEIFGHWDCEWTHLYSELREAPKSHAKGIEIILKEKEKKKFFGSNLPKKVVMIQDQKVKEWILTKITEAMARA
ncbi:vacuolar protein sorting-associated protein 13A [Octopus sinensis]|uniref:Vacuolar protein sorting-associated protein 13A n=1 Tax=Octopus sinensis TaxID=2607531 RepID=A0A7E6FEW9_9MOLL|nr:vacuolar protein sorting-associated protein 13A [Octopus sinensis]